MAIKEAELRRVVTLRRRVAVERNELETAQRQLDSAESDVMQRLAAGEAVTGRFQAVIETVAGKCSPPWKDVYLHHMEAEHETSAAEAEEEVRDNTPTSPGKRRLVVSGPSKRVAA